MTLCRYGAANTPKSFWNKPIPFFLGQSHSRSFEFSLPYKTTEKEGTRIVCQRMELPNVQTGDNLSGTRCQGAGRNEKGYRFGNHVVPVTGSTKSKRVKRKEEPVGSFRKEIRLENFPKTETKHHKLEKQPNQKERTLCVPNNHHV